MAIRALTYDHAGLDEKCFVISIFKIFNFSGFGIKCHALFFQLFATSTENQTYGESSCDYKVAEKSLTLNPQPAVF